MACDYTQDLPIEKGYEAPYDVVLCMVCLETLCVDVEEYNSRLVKVCSLIKKGGSLLLLSTKRSLLVTTEHTTWVPSSFLN